MQIFFIALIAVAVLLAIAAPGFLLVRSGKLKGDVAADFSKVLLYVAAPCLSIYAFSSSTFSPEKLANLGVFALLCLLLQAFMFGIAFLLFGKKQKEAVYRIMTVSCVFANCSFFGNPIIEALFPETASELIVYTTVYALIMNVLGWTVGSAIIKHDISYMKIKKILLNPATVGAVIGFVLFVFSVKLPADVASMIATTGRMSTPLSMLIMGMRLATIKREDGKLLEGKLLCVLGVKLLAMPLICFAFLKFLPIALEIKQILFIISACPVASIVLNFSELLGTGQKDAARFVLFATASCIATLPVVMMLLPYLG